MKFTMPVLAALVLVIAACGGAGAAPADQGATTATTAAEDSNHTQGETEHVDEHEAALTILDASAAADREVAVTLTEFAIEPASIEVKAGETVKFVVTNEGAIQHEFRITNQAAVEEHLAGGHEGAHEEQMTPGMPMMMEGDMVVLVDPGETATVTVEFAGDADYDLVACLLPGHFEAGMKGELTVSS